MVLPHDITLSVWLEGTNLSDNTPLKLYEAMLIERVHGVLWFVARKWRQAPGGRFHVAAKCQKAQHARSFDVNNVRG